MPLGRWRWIWCTHSIRLLGLSLISVTRTVAERREARPSRGCRTRSTRPLYAGFLFSVILGLGFATPTVAQSPLAPAITSANNTTFTVGTSGSFTVTASGSPTPTLSEAGTLPTGVTFNTSNGALSGTPAAGTAATYPITFTAHNSGSATNVLIQKKDQYFGNGSGAASESLAFTSNVTNADLLFCTVGWDTAGGALISSVTDTIGNTYASLPWVVHSPHQMQGFYAFSNSTGADTVTVNFNGTGGTYVGIACGEWSGPTHLDVHGETTGTTSATPTSASVTPRPVASC